MRTQDDKRRGSARPVRLVVVARVRVYRDGLAATLAGGGHEVVAAVPDLASGLAAVAELAPDVVVMDVAYDGALSEIERLARRGPRPPRVLALGVAPQEDAILACAEAGAAGFVTTAQRSEELVETVGRLAEGELVCCERTAAALFRRVGELAGRSAPSLRSERLTARELEIARLIQRGLTNREIAAELRIERATVKNHAHNILAKLDVRSRAEIGTALLDAGAAAREPPDAGLVPGY